MNDFASAFERGQLAAASAQASRKAISDLFESVSGELSSVTDGRLVFALRDFEAGDPLTDIFGLGRLGAPRKKEKYLAAANLKGSGKFLKLAKWLPTEGAFPCRIEYGQKEVTCHDLESLARAIRDLLASVSIAEKLASLIAEPAPMSKDS